MIRRDLDYTAILVMFVSGLYAFLSGLVADLFDLHQFVFHAYAGYICAAAVFLHIVLNTPRIVAYLRRLLGSPPTDAGEGNAPQRGGASLERRDVIVGTISAVSGFLAGRLIPRSRRELPSDVADIGALYHRWSTPGHTLDLPLPDWGARPPAYKNYPRAARVPLPEPRWASELSVKEAVEARRSRREYAACPISAGALSGLVHAAQGITEERLSFRAAPSAGALYPIELYPVVHDVRGIPSGIYHYAVRTHELECLEQGDFRRDVTRAGLYQAFLGEAAVCFILSAVFQRTRWKYRERAYRYVLLEAGHVAQNIYVAATAMGLGACAVGAFYDRQLNELLGLDGDEEAVLYVVSVGELS